MPFPQLRQLVSHAVREVSSESTIMHSINSLRQTLGLTSANQVRNRIEAIKDVLLAHIRRGPNNQILITDAGAELLRQLQELYDSGLTMTEASDVLRSKCYMKEYMDSSVSSASTSNSVIPDHAAVRLAAMQDEIASLRRRIVQLEQQLLRADVHAESSPWWSALREEIDAT